MKQGKVTVADVCKWFDVPVELVESKHPVRAAVELSIAQQAAFLEWSIQPWLDYYFPIES